jgi:hypothetical protein
LRDGTAIAIANTTAQATGTANASEAIGLKFRTIHATPEPTGMAAAIHSQKVQFNGTARLIMFAIAGA